MGGEEEIGLDGEKVLKMEGESLEPSSDENGEEVALHVSIVHAVLWHIRHGRAL